VPTYTVIDVYVEVTSPVLVTSKMRAKPANRW